MSSYFFTSVYVKQPIHIFFQISENTVVKSWDLPHLENVTGPLCIDDDGNCKVCTNKSVSTISRAIVTFAIFQ